MWVPKQAGRERGGEKRRGLRCSVLRLDESQARKSKKLGAISHLVLLVSLKVAGKKGGREGGGKKEGGVGHRGDVIRGWESVKRDEERKEKKDK